MNKTERFANAYVEQYVIDELSQAISWAEREKAGLGCGCHTCAVAAVHLINSWVGWIQGEPNPNYEYSVDKCGRIYRPDGT